MKQIVIQILLILFFYGFFTNAQSCEPFVVENDTTILFNVTTSGSCWCDNYIGNGSQLLVTTNTNLIDTINSLMARIATLEQKLAKVTVSDDSNTIYLTGVNLNVISGSNNTNGTINGLGNIIDTMKTT